MLPQEAAFKGVGLHYSGSSPQLAPALFDVRNAMGRQTLGSINFLKRIPNSVNPNTSEAYENKTL
ncbi:hypothetical protein DDZ13_14605 [Coraliomargarita sinensis]|uniref:Uncharacterized protein n=1 Tax=Coraliomargarita sinensis TaxID=2174842 RepID=A0A317ZD57_9BACT|nr:hypothetical protein DDZ13_14605 [Coraliomargarita sinensis]